MQAEDSQLPRPMVWGKWTHIKVVGGMCPCRMWDATLATEDEVKALDKTESDKFRHINTWDEKLLNIHFPNEKDAN